MLPHERELVERLKNKPFALIGINTDDPDSWSKRSKDDPVAWRNVLDGGTSGPICKAWNVQRFPTIYVLDATGRIRYTDVRGEAMDQAVDRLLLELEKPAQDPSPAPEKPARKP